MASRYNGADDVEEEILEENDGLMEGDEGSEDEGFLDIVDNFDEAEGDAELSIVSDGGEEEDNQFDKIVGILEEIIMDPEFIEAQNAFCRQHCSVFEDTDENKLEYTPIFQQFTELIEGMVEARLTASLPGVSLAAVGEMIKARAEEMQYSDVWDVLVSFTDFQTFKELMISHKQSTSSCQLVVDVRASVIHADEQTDGEARPDLDMNGICVSPLSSPADKMK